MMKNLLTKTTELSMYVTLDYIREGDLVIDATCGNGNDTLLLSAAVGESGDVLAVDIQEEAVEKTKKRLQDAGAGNVKTIQGSFCFMDQFLSAWFPDCRPAAVVFNLGYLPGGNKAITTRTDETVSAVAKAAELVRKDGIVTVVMYSGHPEGEREKAEVLAMAKKLPKDRFHVVFASMLNQDSCPPEILWITRKK